MTNLSPQALQEDEVNRIPIHGPETYASMRKAGQLAALTLDYITPIRTGRSQYR